MYAAYCIAKNIGMELNLAVGESNYMLPNYMLLTLNTCMVDVLMNSYVTNIQYLIIHLIVLFCQI